MIQFKEAEILDDQKHDKEFFMQDTLDIKIQFQPIKFKWAIENIKQTCLQSIYYQFHIENKTIFIYQYSKVNQNLFWKENDKRHISIKYQFLDMVQIRGKS